MTEHKKNQTEMKYFRRQLRKNSTPAECTLWKLLKGKHIDGMSFRRQYSVDRYIIDFYCPQLKLGIELDGDYNYYCGSKENDIDRSYYDKLVNDAADNISKYGDLEWFVSDDPYGPVFVDNDEDDCPFDVR